MLNSNLTTIYNTIMNCPAPPGLTHPLLKENFAWVDKRLEQLYYGYALTSENYEDFEYLYNNKYSDVDSILGVKDSILGVKEYSILGKRKRSDSDISEYEEDRIQDNNVYYDFDEYDYIYKTDNEEDDLESISLSVSDYDFKSVASDQNVIENYSSDWTIDTDVVDTDGYTDYEEDNN